jgi:hypothetical protein
MSEEEGERGFSIRVRKMGSGGNWGATEAGESSELQYKWKARRKEGFSGIAPSSRNMGFSSQKNKNKWALRWIGFCIGLVGCPCFILEGLNTIGSH